MLKADVKCESPASLIQTRVGGTSHSFLRLGDMGTRVYPQPGTLKRPREQNRESGGMGPHSPGLPEPEVSS